MAVISSRKEISKKSRVMGNEAAMLGKGGSGMKNLSHLGEQVGVHLESTGEPRESFDQSSIIWKLALYKDLPRLWVLSTNYSRKETLREKVSPGVRAGPKSMSWFVCLFDSLSKY